jgi:hypothetical protein
MKAQRSKNLCSTRDLVAELFIAILVNLRFEGEGGSEEVAYPFIDRSLGAGDHFLFSSGNDP